MFNRIFNKRGTKARGKSRGSGLSAASASASVKVVTQVEGVPQVDVTIDDTILALDRELSNLSGLQVAQAAKERGWAALHRELERHPVRAASPTLLSGGAVKGSTHGGSVRPVLAGHSRGWRVALSSAGVAVVILAVVLGTYGAGLFGDGGGTLVSVTTTEASTPATTVATGDTTPTTVNTPDTTGTTPTTAITPDTTGTTPTSGNTTPTTDSTPTTGGSSNTTQRVTSTTLPAQTTTTNATQMAAAEREKDAKNAAWDLGAAVLDYFSTGELGGTPALTDAAQGSLTIMVKSLDAPTEVHVVGAKTNSDGTVRVTLQFVDGDESPRFFITVRVSDGGTTVTDISAGS